ncbi:MAG: AAA domain-containing protein [Syntrophomonadaceae bacterium]|nr:AAA domain-containing protein [Syntrophomonadaceae bacterium]
MINTEKLKAVLADYKRDFVSQQWENEKYKWEALKHFQEHWDINAPDFLSMFWKATDKTTNLLASMNNFPRAMIRAFAEADAEATRAMFISLFDESRSFTERIQKFQSDAETLRVKYDDGTWKQHYQNSNSISTYLWLRYPDKYYIYKYSECRAVAKELESDYVPKKGSSSANLTGWLKLYDDICGQLAKDTELVQLLQSVLTDSCYADKALKTLTIDVGFYISRHYSKNKWFPDDYSPNISTHHWLQLLADEAVFIMDSLKIMKRMKDYGGAATCKQLAVKYGDTNNFYNVGSSSLAQRVAKATGCPLMKTDTDNSKWWPILYLGKYAEKKTEGVYIWKLRDELSKALDQVDLSKIPLYTNEKIDPDFDAYSKDEFLQEVYMTGDRYDTLVSLLRNKKNLILQGAPGVGKTFAARRLAYSVMGEKDDGRIEFIQFHQSYSYEDFIMGYKPQGEGFELQNGVFYRFCQKAANTPDKEFFFIIDEINRGNVSKIFGELLMLIEKEYRGAKATLAYNGMPFTVPQNVYIIGMMNTADRSLAMIDYALRRRFSFYEMEPGFNSAGFKAYQEGFDDETLNALIERIQELNKEITADSSLGSGFCIGHSYFCAQEECTDEWMIQVVEYDILPMLSEYWFDEPRNLHRWGNILRGVFDV